MLFHSLSPLFLFFSFVYFVVSSLIVVVDDFFVVWLIMELQMITFVSMFLLISYNIPRGFTVYFLTQSISSLVIITLFLMNNFDNFLMLFFFLIKLGVFPVVNWYIWSLSTFSNTLLMFALTLQKLPSLTLLHLLPLNLSSGFMSGLLILLCLNIFYCSLMSGSSTTVLHSFIWLSMGSTFWKVVLLFQSYSLFLCYFMIYAIFTLWFFMSGSLLGLISLVNFSSLPPFPDFFFKVYIISCLYVSSVEMSAVIIVSLIALVFNVYYSMSFLSLIMKTMLNKVF